MKRKSSESGSALIEFAGSLILFATLLTGIFQIGYTFYTYENLIHAVRAGARYAAHRASNAAGDPQFASSVRNLVVYGDPQPKAGARPVAPGLAPGQVELVLDRAASTVSVRGYSIDALFTKVRLDGRPTVTFPIGSGGAQ